MIKDWLKEFWKEILGGVAIILLFGLLIKWACYADYRQGKVVGTQWQHSTSLRERTLARDGDWGRPPSSCGYYNESTFDHYCEQRQRGSWCCGGRNKDGVCLMNCPDYDKWCSYSFWDWPVIETKTITGGDEEPEEYPTFGDLLDKDHRETNWQVYVVTFLMGRKEWDYETKSRVQFNKFVDGDWWEIKVPRFGSKEPIRRTDAEGTGSSP